MVFFGTDPKPSSWLGSSRVPMQEFAKAMDSKLPDMNYSLVSMILAYLVKQNGRNREEISLGMIHWIL